MSMLMQLWDMRNTMTPVKEFVGHTRGNDSHSFVYDSL